VSGDNFDLVGGDPHDLTTTTETRSANAIAEPTPDGYRPCWRKISLITKINSCAQSKNEQESEVSNLNITRRWSSESQRTSHICACSGVAKAQCKTKLESENKRGVYLNRGRSPWRPRGAGLQYPRVLFTRVNSTEDHMGLQLGQQPKRCWRSALADSGRQLVLQIPVDSG
jgi:hypothetical protein